MKASTMYAAAAVLAGLAVWQWRRQGAAPNMDGSGGRPWSQVPNESAAETARLQAWATLRPPAAPGSIAWNYPNDQSAAETARLMRTAPQGQW